MGRRPLAWLGGLGILTKAGAGLTPCWSGTSRGAVPVFIFPTLLGSFPFWGNWGAEVLKQADDGPLGWGRSSGFLSPLRWNHLQFFNFTSNIMTFTKIERVQECSKYLPPLLLYFHSSEVPAFNSLIYILFPCTNTPTRGVNFPTKRLHWMHYSVSWAVHWTVYHSYPSASA